MFQTIDILKDLIRIPSFVDGNHNEAELASFIENFIEKYTKYNYITQQVEGNRRNILVFNKPNPKIALFGHMDTVLPKAETETPFVPRIDGDKLYGLGSVDMKSGLAIMLKLATEINNDDFSLVFSVDEEYEFKGAIKLKEFKGFNPQFIINVEPTENKILSGCRGITEFSLIVHGKSAHAGRKEFGVNAIEKAVELISEFQKEITSMDIEDGGRSTINLAYLNGGTLKDSGDGKTEVSGLGMIVPNFAEINCEIRIANSNITEGYVEKEFAKIAEKCGVNVSDFKFKFLLGSMLTPKEELKSFEDTVREEIGEVNYADISLAGYYEVQMLQENWKSQSVVFGASPINLSHSANEYVNISSLEKMEKVVRKFVDRTLKSD